MYDRAPQARSLFVLGGIMKNALLLISVCLAGLPLLSQQANSGALGPDKWTVGTVMQVKEDPGTKSDGASSGKSYDISVKVGDTMYVVLYTAPAGNALAPYRVGLDLAVLVGSKTLTFNDKLGRTREVPILSRETIAPQPPQ